MILKFITSIIFLGVLTHFVISQDNIRDINQKHLAYCGNDIKCYDTLIKLAKIKMPLEALDYSLNALDIASNLEDYHRQAIAWEHISICYRGLGNNVKAIESSLIALSIYDSMKMDVNTGMMQLQIGSHFTNEKNFNKGLKYIKEALVSFRNINDSVNIPLALINLGETYRLMHKYDSAANCFNECLSINKNKKNNLIRGYAVGNLGMVHSATGEYDSAKVELKEALELLKSLHDLHSLSVYQSDLAMVYILEGQFKKGEKLLLKSLAMVKKEKLKEPIRDFSSDLADFYEEKGEYKKALAYRKQYEIYHDSLVNIENVRKIEQLHSQYWLDKKEASIQLLENENQQKRNQVLALGAGVLLFVALSLILYRVQRQRKRALQKVSQQKKIIEKREKEKALLLKELNHRVKNNLQMVASLINIQAGQCKEENITKALKTTQNRIDTLVLIHQKLYSEQEDMKVDLNNYINELANNLIYGASSKANLTLKATSVLVHIDAVISLGLILNELITNSLKYATMPNKELELNVTLCQENEQVKLSVSDNGPGVPTEYTKGKTGSMGMKLVQSLVKQLKGQLQYQHSEGSCWTLTLNSENLN